MALIIRENVPDSRPESITTASYRLIHMMSTQKYSDFFFSSGTVSTYWPSAESSSSKSVAHTWLTNMLAGPTAGMDSLKMVSVTFVPPNVSTKAQRPRVHRGTTCQ